ncbi:MAG: S9 family peptidase [Saprospirales bacterium]|nr:MAG: S9 family peptidase [Saprospirales bacterium]
MYKIIRNMKLLFNLLLFVFLLLIQTSGIQSQGMTPWDVAMTEIVSAAAIDNQSGYVAFIRSTPANPLESNTPPSSSLHIISLESGEIRDVELSSGVSGLSIRPGHSGFTFLTRFEDDQSNSIAQVCVKSGEVTRLFQFNTNIAGYQWNPDGERVAFMARLPQKETQPQLPYVPEIFEEGLVNQKAWVANVNSTWPDIKKMKVSGSTYLIEWSPKGDKLALSAAPTPHIDDRFMFQRVRVVDPTTGNVINEINNRGKIVQITWSPDGTRLALLAGDDIHDPIAGRIMMVSSTGGDPENIFSDFEGKFEQIEWVEDDQIQVRTSESTASIYGTINTDGSNYTKIIDEAEMAINRFHRAPNGDAVFVGSTPRFPNEVFLYRSGSRVLERITHHNEWLKDRHLGEQRVVSYLARDGKFEIDGMLILPKDYQQGQRYPLIVMVHGGPEAHYSNGWLTNYSMPGQVAADRGFAVFYPNYRGSTGRGIEFITSSQMDLSGAEFDDVVDGVDFLIQEGIADPNRVGVTGGSYGGYATAWMSTYYSDRFAAGVMFVGISNNISKWGTSDIPEELFLVHTKQRLWDDWLDNLKRSPIYYVDKAQTPLLIMHGKEDTRVHPGQSLEMYRHLRVRKPDLPVRLVWYPNEGHGNIRASSRFDYNLRMLEWFETFLLEEGGQLPSSELKFERAGITD